MISEIFELMSGSKGNGLRSVRADCRCTSLQGYRKTGRFLVRKDLLAEKIFVSGVCLDSLKGALDVPVGVAEGYGAAVGAGGGVFGLCEFGEEPVDFFRVEGLVDFYRGVAGH
jgi:hypothetical protein